MEEKIKKEKKLIHSIQRAFNKNIHKMCNIFFRMVKLEIISLARSAACLGRTGGWRSEQVGGLSMCAAKRIFSLVNNLHVNFPIDERHHMAGAS